MLKDRFNLRKVAIIFACLAVATTFLSCKKDSKNNGNEGKFHWSNKSNIFVVIDSVKYNLYDRITVQNLIDAGYTLDDKLSANQEYNISDDLRGETASTISMYKDGRKYFNVKPILPIVGKAVLKNCVIDEFYITYYSYNEKNISVMGELKSKCTKEEVQDVFGNPTKQNNTLLFYNDDPIRGAYFYFYFDKGASYGVTTIKVGCWLE